MEQTVEDQTTKAEQPTARISPLIVIFLLTSILGLVAAVVMLANEDTGPPETIGSPVLSGWQATDFELESLDGELVRLSDYEGRLIFLNIWRTDCPPCVREMPALQQFVQEQGPDGAVVLAVNQGEQAEDIRVFLDEIGVDALPVLLDRDLTLDQNYRVVGLPTTYIISPEGKVEFTKLGELTVEEMYTYVDELG